MSGSLEKRFHRKLSPYKTATGCVEWTGATNGKYGLIRSSKKPFPWLLAHRIAYEMHYGNIPSGMDVMHKCDNPRCVSWEHLSIGTRKENMKDMVSKGRQRQSSFSETDIERIRDKRKFGVIQQEIADSYGVSRPLISMLLSGRIAPFKSC